MTEMMALNQLYHSTDLWKYKTLPSPQIL